MFVIRHEIKDVKKISVLCNCPYCGESFMKDKKLIGNIKLLTYNEKIKQIESDMKKGEDYVITCSCGRFQIIYVNMIDNTRNVTEDNLIDNSIIEDKKITQ
jgi:hypothetical protein